MSPAKHTVSTISAVVFLPVIASLFVAANAGWLADVSPVYLMRDTAALAKVPFYCGALSILGIGLWAATVAVCLIAFLSLKHPVNDDGTSWYFGWIGVLTLLLALDDALQLHELVGPQFLGIESKVFYGAYAIMAIVIFTRFYGVVQANESGLLLASIFCFACSVGIDVAHDVFSLSFNRSVFLEDTFKLLGITSWFAYFSNLAVLQFKTVIHRIPN